MYLLSHEALEVLFSHTPSLLAALSGQLDLELQKGPLVLLVLLVPQGQGFLALLARL